MVRDMDVGVMIVFDDAKMLVNRRPEGSYYAGWWEWPGGKRNPNESFESCAKRELYEEIGIEVNNVRLFESQVSEYPDRRVNLRFFVGDLAGPRKARSDALEHRWIAPVEALELRFLEQNLGVLRKILAGASP